MRNRTVIALLAAGQFVMVLDSSVMNVSISRLVADLDTSVASIQLAITAHTLVMASFMLIGALLLTGLAGAFRAEVSEQPAIPADVRSAIEEATTSGLDFVPAEVGEAIAADAGLSSEQVGAIGEAYRDGRLAALKSALGVVSLFALGGFFVARALPDRPLRRAASAHADVTRARSA